VKVILLNLGRFAYNVNAGDRIAQMVVSKYESVEWDALLELAESVRGSGGFGSSGR
jgi:dUTP pyrophosphatase